MPENSAKMDENSKPTRHKRQKYANHSKDYIYIDIKKRTLPSVSKVYACSEEGCNEAFLKFSQINKHLQSVHGVEKVACYFCAHITTFDEIAKHAMMEHKTLNTVKLPAYRCRECTPTLQFPDKYGYSRHIHMVHFPTRVLKTRNCSICGESFTLKEMKKHIREAHSKPDLQCDLCAYTTKSNQSLKVHLQARHYDHKICCKICGLEMRSWSLSQHLRTRHGATTQNKNGMSVTWSVKCPHCGLHRRTKERILAHIKRAHLKVEPFQCAACGVRTSNMTDMRMHILGIHYHSKSVSNFDESMIIVLKRDTLKPAELKRVPVLSRPASIPASRQVRKPARRPVPKERKKVNEEVALDANLLNQLLRAAGKCTFNVTEDETIGVKCEDLVEIDFDE